MSYGTYLRPPVSYAPSVRRLRRSAYGGSGWYYYFSGLGIALVATLDLLGAKPPTKAGRASGLLTPKEWGKPVAMEHRRFQALSRG